MGCLALCTLVLLLLLLLLLSPSLSQGCTWIPRASPCDLTQIRGCGIVLYEETGFGGLRLELSEAADDLGEHSFDNASSSLLVKGCPWVACTRAGCRGEGGTEVFEEGCYPDLLHLRKAVSCVRPVRGSLDAPSIQLFAEAGATGRTLSLEREANLEYSGLNDRVSSHRVRAGVWLLSEHGGNAGRKRLAGPGDVLNYSAWSLEGRLTHLCPLRQGVPTVLGARLDCGAAVVNSSVEVVNELVLENRSPAAQSMSVRHQLQAELSVSQRLTFSAYTLLRQGASFFLDVSRLHGALGYGLGAELRLELERGFWVEKGVAESRRRALGRAIEVEATVPPGQTLGVRLELLERHLVVPVLLRVQHGCRVVEERANFTCVDRTTVNLQYTSQK